MKKKELTLFIIPFLLTSIIIFGHYFYLSTQNPQAHLAPAVAVNAPDTLKEAELKPLAPQTPFPNSAKGIITATPTSNNALNNLLVSAREANLNLLVLQIDLSFIEDGSLFIPQASSNSKETLLSWVKKTVSEAHRSGFHTYLKLRFIDESEIKDRIKFLEEISQMINFFGKTAEEYKISFFDPGITLGQTSFASVPEPEMQTLLNKIEKEARKYYTGRIGISVCCTLTNFNLRGYNQLSVIGSSGEEMEALLIKAASDAQKYGIEKVFLIDEKQQTITSQK